MNERAFRLDFFVAMAALLISALTVATLIYQTRVIGNQYAATIWPYLGVESTYGLHGEEIQVVNDGLGPALIRSAQLWVDEKPVPTWNDYFRVLAADPDVRRVFLQNRAALLSGGNISLTLTTGSIGPSSTLRPGEVQTLLRIAFSGPVPAVVLQEIQSHLVAIDFCYCSLNGTCWTKHAEPGSDTVSDPKPVNACTSTASITFDTHLPKKRSAP
ncbi:MAG TPA: hypothetical protein VEJ41_02895 [Candidatus Acidoferrales bacterium]|nr:hypothetical protein [Candidatus Acidoferrales bacterium]